MNWQKAEFPIKDNSIQEVLGYHPDWIDEDYNPSGVRMCAIGGSGEFLASSYWCGQHDMYENEHFGVHDTDILPEQILIIDPPNKLT